MARGLETRIRGVWRVYVAFEHHTYETRRLSRAFIIEMAPPFRVGKGLRLRLGDRAVQAGWCRKHRDSDPLEQIGGRDLAHDPTEIGRWWNGVAPQEDEAS